MSVQIVWRQTWSGILGISYTCIHNQIYMYINCRQIFHLSCVCLRIVEFSPITLSDRLLWESERHKIKKIYLHVL
jgi:hypothetical protein